MTVGRGNLPGSDFESPCYGEQTAAARRGIAATSPTGYWVGAERDLGCKNPGPQSVSSCRSKSLHDCDGRPVTILGSGPLMDDDGAMVCNDPAASAVGEQTTHDNKVGSRDICCNYYTRFSHRARDDVWPGAVDSTQAATSLPDSIVGRRMACQSDIHVAALGGRRGDC